MMKYFLPAAISLLFLASCGCKKDWTDIDKNDPYKNLCPVGYDDHAVTGTWRRTVVYNGFSGQPEPTAANSYTVLTLNANKRYTIALNGQVTKTGVYDTATYNSLLMQRQELGIYFDNTPTPTIVHTFHDSLSLSPDVYDGGGSLYRRDCR